MTSGARKGSGGTYLPEIVRLRLILSFDSIPLSSVCARVSNVSFIIYEMKTIGCPAVVPCGKLVSLLPF